MREIKFRVWCKQYEEFIQFNKMGFLEDGSLWYIQGVDENEKEIDPPYFENQNDWELMQYAGLKDKNGVEIFDGDIVSSIDFEHNREYKGIVVFDRGGFRVALQIKEFKFKLPFNSFEENESSLQVLGNIYENPELLEREGK